MTNTQIKRVLFNRVTIITLVIITITALCIIPAIVKANKDRAKHAQVESVGITLIKSELEVYRSSHDEYPATITELLKDAQVTESGGTATTLKVLPYFTNLRYSAANDSQTYTITYTSYGDGVKTVTGGKVPST